MVVQSLQELLATLVDEANACEINQKRRTVERNLLPALVELVYASARELSLDDESCRRRFVLTSNSYNFISHTLARRAICLPQYIQPQKGTKKYTKNFNRKAFLCLFVAEL